MEQFEMLAKVFDILDELQKPECPTCHVPVKDSGALCSLCASDLEEARQFMNEWPGVVE